MSLLSKEELSNAICSAKIVAVVRAKSAEQVEPLADALYEAGITAIEITMTTPGALIAIENACRRLPKAALIGVGTVLDAPTASQAIAAGARFIVSPITRPEIAQTARAAGLPVMLGAYTPTEAQAAWEAGTDFVKLFPADNLGISYIKALRAPLPHLKIVPTGGVTLQNISQFLEVGCPAVGVGSSLLLPELLQNARWKELTELASRFVLAARPR